MAKLQCIQLVETVEMNLAVLCNAVLPDPFLFPLIAIRSIGIFQKRQQTNGDKELRQSWLGWNWFFLFKLMRKLKLCVIMEDTNQLFLAVELLFNIHIQFWVSFPSSPVSFSTLLATVSMHSEWHCMANLRGTVLDWGYVLQWSMGCVLRELLALP